MANSKHINRVGLYVRSRRDELGESLARLIEFLEKKSISYCFEETSYSQLPKEILTKKYETFSSNDNYQLDLILVVGGDGSFLHACQLFANHDITLAGVNLGRLGFLTDISPKKLDESLTPILNGRSIRERRHFIEGKVASQQITALNDIVIRTSAEDTIMDVSVNIDGDFAFSLRCDGIVFTTPTGSTAHGLSAGGPLLHPGVDAFVIVPIAAHTLSARPCVIPATKSIEIRQCSENLRASVSFDGNCRAHLDHQQSIFIDRSPHFVTLSHPLDYNYFVACRSKFGWNTNPGRN